MRAAPGAPRVVTLRALGLGDLLTAFPALRALRRALPRHHHVLLCPSPLEPVARASGAIDEIVPFSALGGVDPEQLPALAGAPAVAVNLHGRGPDSHRLLLGLGPDRLVSFRHDAVLESWGGPVWDPDRHEVRRWCDLLEHAGIPADPSDLHLPCAADRPSRRTTTLIHPGAASASRRWPPERFAAVAAARRRAGDTVVVTGSASERSLVARVVAGAGLGRGADRSGTSLPELVELVASAARVVCGDTGVAHLATACRTPSVVLFGPTAPSRWGPPEGSALHRALWAGREGDPHGTTPDPGLLELTAHDVLRALDDLDASLARA